MNYSISQLSYDCKYNQKIVTFEINSEVFKCEGRTMKEPGYTEIIDWQAVDDNKTLPNFSVGQEVDVKEVCFCITKHQWRYCDYSDFVFDTSLVLSLKSIVKITTIHLI